MSDISAENSDIFPACVFTRAQSRAFDNVETLADSFFSESVSEVVCPVDSGSSSQQGEKVPNIFTDNLQIEWKISRDQLVEAQKADPSLLKYFTIVGKLGKMPDKSVTYFMESDVLMRNWRSRQDPELYSAVQIVVPVGYRQHVLSLAHDSPWAGHLGITKTYSRILKHFFWPGMKTDVSKYCRSCHVCQITGKPNQMVPPAPLCPVPAVGEPFEKVLVDCVGPLPKSKTGNQFLLTIMCTATRFPEAIPLRKITAQSVTQALLKFFSTFGLPRIIQTDQGNNFLSKLFAQVLKTLNIQHVVSSSYHPESQGALERFHQSLKSMLRSFVWTVVKPGMKEFLLLCFAAREAVQESLSFSPAELVFGHTVRGPLKLLKESFLTSGTVDKPTNLLDYVSKFRERLHQVWDLAKRKIKMSQESMKKTFDKKAIPRSFSPGDKVLALLPVPGSSLTAKFSGPYTVKRKLSDTDYAIETPERKKKIRVCHINMLKEYFSRFVPGEDADAKLAPVVAVSILPDPSPYDDGLNFHSQTLPSARLSNTEALSTLPSQLDHLTVEQQDDLISLIREFPSIFVTFLFKLLFCSHDIKVITDTPIKQHPYRVNMAKRSVMKQEVEYLLEHGFAKPSVSPWSSPCVLVPKPDGTFRFCTDYRKVNAVTLSDSYPLLVGTMCRIILVQLVLFSKLDLLKGYWQVPLTPEASEI
uniref:Gypsy retrotransposon integrase-like protein 1 n=1 Tax=Astyanax mexicanus TaxID=7994 RepID=A0A3B1JEH9_ASTMX